MSVPLTEKTRKKMLLYSFSHSTNICKLQIHIIPTWHQIYTKMKNISSFNLNICDQSEDHKEYMLFHEFKTPRNGRSRSSITISPIISLGEYNPRSGLDTEEKNILALSWYIYKVSPWQRNRQLQFSNSWCTRNELQYKKHLQETTHWKPYQNSEVCYLLS